MNDILERKLNLLNIKRQLKKNQTLANYKPYKHVNNFILISGQLPVESTGKLHSGKISEDISEKRIKIAVEIAASNLLWNLSDCIKNISIKVSEINCCNIKGYFNCNESFENHPVLLDYASNLIVKVLGKPGQHSRTAIGVSSLPKNSLVEIEGIFSIS